MTEEVQITQDEREVLEARAEKLGIKFHPSLSTEKLKERVSEAMKEPEDEASETETEAQGKETENAFRLRKRKEASELVRIQVTCMNPNKSEWEGEIFTVGNGVVGTFKKYIPFNVEWHVPRIILKQLKQRKCQIFQAGRGKNRAGMPQSKLINEYNVVELPPLTKEELKELAQRQAMAKGTSQ